MLAPEIRKENAVALLETKFIKVYDLQYAEGKHYYDASRREVSNLAAVKSEEEFRQMLPDAVTCIVVLKTPSEEPRLLLSYEYRYPAGRYLLSPPAGLIDPSDRDGTEPLVATAKREIFEETGIRVKDTDRVTVLSPLAFSSPGMTDESNALVSVVIELNDLSELTQKGAQGSELFSGFELLTKAEAEDILRKGIDKYGRFYSVYTWCALNSFISGRY